VETVTAAREAGPDRLERLRVLADALAETLEPDRVARIVVEHALVAMGATAALVGLLSADGSEILVASEVGYRDSVLAPWRRFAVSASVPLAEAVRTGLPVFVQTEEEWRSRYPDAAPTLDARAERGPLASWAALPLITRGRVVGVLGVTLPGPAAVSAADREFVEALARQCAQALEHARLYAEVEAARREAEAQRDRIAFLAEASALLSASLDYQTTLNHVARLAVPRYADWCAVDIAGPEGQIERLAVAHVDPAKVAWAAELQRKYPPKADAPTGVPAVLRSGVSEFYPEVTDEMLVAGARGNLELLADMRAIGFHSVLTVPMRARGRTLGAITLVTTNETGRRFTEDDRALIEALGERAGLAVDNARLYQESVAGETRFRDLADTAPVLIWMGNVQGENEYLNRPWLEFTGVTDAATHAGYGWQAWVHPDDLPALRTTFRNAYATRTPSEVEFRLRRADGQWRWMLNRGRPRYDAHGQFVGFIGSCVDVTDHKEAEAALIENEARQRALLSDVLASVTEGRLMLVETPEQLPARLDPAGPPIDLTLPSLRELRKQTQEAAKRDGFPEERWQDLQTAVGEASMNAVVHAGGGTAAVGVRPGTVQVWIEDSGAGISMDRIPQATLLRGFSSAGTLGHGFWMILKTCDRVWLRTGPTGTTIVLEQDRELPLPAWLRDK
jgi:PAS domain S-box-containing protein